MADLDASGSTTASESEIERLEQYSGPPSPRSSSRRFRERISQLAPKVPVSCPMGSKLLDMDEDGSKSKSRYGKADVSKAGLEDTGPGMGGVMVDSAPFAASKLDNANEYEAWQMRRQARAAASASLGQTQEVSFSNMGLFANLPGELRNRIYRLTLLTPSADEPFLIVMQPGTCSLGPCTHARLSTAVPGLLSTCRLIRHEAMPIFCAENIFKFDTRTVRERCTGNWLRALGWYGGLIPQVILDVVVWETDPAPLHGTAKWGKDYEVKVSCPINRPGGKSEFDVCVAGRLIEKACSECERLHEHMAMLNKRIEDGEVGKEIEKLLLEFVWSDWFAELVFRCAK